jgi:hypothetical protein
MLRIPRRFFAKRWPWGTLFKLIGDAIILHTSPNPVNLFAQSNLHYVRLIYNIFLFASLHVCVISFHTIGRYIDIRFRTFVQNLDLLSRRSRRIPVPTSNGASSHDLPFPLDNVTRTERQLTLHTSWPSTEVLGEIQHLL